MCFAAFFLLTGCGASLTVYDYTENGVHYNMYELSLDTELKNNMEQTAAIGADGKKYTVEKYFGVLFSDFGYELVGAEFTDKAYVARYRKEIKQDAVSELFATGTEVSFDVSHTENPFLRTYTSVSPNPFNGVRAAYDSAPPQLSSTVAERLKNGSIAHNEYGEDVIAYHSVIDAFPYLKNFNPDGLPLNYVRYGSKRMSSSGNTLSTDGTVSAYGFTRYFDTTDTEIAFEYNRAVPYGWYITALAAGGAVFAAILFATRTKKQKPTLLDRFPYNPEEYRDYESRLPQKR